MTLQEVKEQVAKKHLYKSWKQLRIDRVISDVILDEVSKEYAKQVAEQALLDASENAIMYCVDREPEGVDKDSILNTSIQLL